MLAITSFCRRQRRLTAAECVSLRFPAIVVAAAAVIFFAWFLRDREKKALWRALFGRAPALGIPSHIPAIGIPVNVGRGQIFAAGVRSVFSPGNPRVARLLVCDASNGAPDIVCALDVVRAMLPATTELTVLRPTPRVGQFFSVSECWNAIAEDSLVRARDPWVLILNDDVGFAPGELAVGAASAWAHHSTHAAVFVNHGPPGTGQFFSAFALSRVGYLGVGSFDENFFPAYFEDCDWFYRLNVLGLKWHVEREWDMLHPVPHDVPDIQIETCVAASPASALDAARARQAAILRLIVLSTDGTDGRRRVQLEQSSPNILGHRDYYMRKWGATKADCGYGNYENPFNDARLPISHWEFDVQRRRAIIDAVALQE